MFPDGSGLLQRGASGGKGLRPTFLTIAARSLRSRAVPSRPHQQALASPVYNFDANAVIKNLIELTGDAWENKVVGFLCAAGGKSSYMSIMAFANSPMLDFRSVIAPRFVYATGNAFEDGRLADADIARRVADLVRATVRLSAALSASQEPSPA